MSVISKSSPIVIVGAGVFGLTTAIHLAQRGYTNVKILDKQAYKQNLYAYEAGCDAASADINKILRVAYGAQREYQDLALDSISHFRKWNEEIRSGRTLPPGFTNSDAIFCNNGDLTINTEGLTQFDFDTIKNLAASGAGDTHFVLTNPEHVKRAEQQGFGFAVNPFGRPSEENYGLLDTSGGMVYADRACRFALHKAEILGVQLVLGPGAGTFSTLLRNADDSNKVIGVRTEDGVSHRAALTIMACGGWTPSLVPELDGLCEATCGSVSTFQLPVGNKRLWERFAPENFPTWKYRVRDGAAGGLYGFARDSQGRVKIGYRGTKYTNPQVQADSAVRSVPVTRWTEQSTRKLPQQAADVIKGFVQQYLPELVSCPVTTRLCWYTDSFDNHFVIDFVPGVEGLMVATGGSGHGFKFLPNLGSYVVDRIEGKEDGAGLLARWRWRGLKTDEKASNSIMEGTQSKRALQKQSLTDDDSLSGRAGSL